jgi:hypothetical protein
MRRKSIFQNTKSIFEETVETTNEVLGLVKDQVILTRQLNRNEDAVELLESKQELVIAKAEITVATLDQVKQLEAMDIPEQIKANLIAELNNTLN